MNHQKQPQPSDLARLRCGWEKPSALASEFLPLAQRQQAEIGENYEPFDPDWDHWFRLERAGACIVWTARTIGSGALVGYVVWTLGRGMNCVRTIFAEARLIYLAPEWREGLTGYRFLKSSVAAIDRDMKPDIIRIETNALYENDRLGVILKRLGMRRVGSVWRSA